MNKLQTLLAIALGLFIGGCGNLVYYKSLAKGEYDLLKSSEPITNVIKDTSRDPALRQRLQKVLDARIYAIQVLKLPNNTSYTQYADLGRPYVLWNVFAAPELSLDPLEHCFLFAGCVAYRGYFDQKDALSEANALITKGYEVYVAGVPAYSTLGWFDDPLINTMMNWSDEYLISTVFHELAHQQLYLKGDTAFNESFANFVGEEGLRQYLKSEGLNSSQEQQSRQRQGKFTSMILDTRQRLTAIYHSKLAPDAQRQQKQAEFARLRKTYAALRAGEWKDFDAYDRWFAGELNNAVLLPFGLYDEWTQAFAALFREQHQDWSAFYAAAKELSKKSDKEIQQRLQQLKQSGHSTKA